MEPIRAQPEVETRDERLGEALSLLRKPPKHRGPGYVVLLAGCGLIGAVTFLVYAATKAPVTAKPAVVTTVTRPEAIPAHKADFELSGTAPSAEVADSVTEAVPLGSESAR